jgi:hypothetical protein
MDQESIKTRWIVALAIILAAAATSGCGARSASPTATAGAARDWATAQFDSAGISYSRVSCDVSPAKDGHVSGFCYAHCSYALYSGGSDCTATGLGRSSNGIDEGNDANCHYDPYGEDYLTGPPCLDIAGNFFGTQAAKA